MVKFEGNTKLQQFEKYLPSLCNNPSMEMEINKYQLLTLRDLAKRGHYREIFHVKTVKAILTNKF